MGLLSLLSHFPPTLENLLTAVQALYEFDRLVAVDFISLCLHGSECKLLSKDSVKTLYQEGFIKADKKVRRDIKKALITLIEERGLRELVSPLPTKPKL